MYDYSPKNNSTRYPLFANGRGNILVCCLVSVAVISILGFIACVAFSI